jgi:glycosyltransferase 2 family protein
MLRFFFRQIFPWVITLGALYWVFRDVDWHLLLTHLRSASATEILLAVALTASSYLLRALRWQFLFPRPVLTFFKSLRVVILGFFMNNILPARAGELVRAHLGSKVTGESRALVLGTIASERLVDGLTISIFFVAFSMHIDHQYAQNLLWVALAFAGASLGVIVFLAARSRIITTLKRLSKAEKGKWLHYLGQKAESFVDGLSPLYNKRTLVPLVFLSLMVWSVELLVYFIISHAYGTNLSLAESVLFLVAVNFSSLIPAAPGGIGVIELVATKVLVSIGIQHEHALTMVLTQHIIQYLVIGVPGAVALLTWHGRIQPTEGGTDGERSLEQGTSS